MNDDDDDKCTRCEKVVPLRGYVCGWCVFDELGRIRKLPVEEVRPALEALDREQFGYVKTPQEHYDDAHGALKRLGRDLRDNGVDVVDLD